MLRNETGSFGYVKFLQSIGQLVRLRGCTDYCGGLDTENDVDGAYTYMWKGDATQVCVVSAFLWFSMAAIVCASYRAWLRPVSLQGCLPRGHTHADAANGSAMCE